MKEIDRPLGMSARPVRGGPGLPAAGSVIAALCALIIVGSSATIALREREWRAPPAAAVATPQQHEPAIETAAAAPSAPSAVERRPQGPAIIRVEREPGQPSGGAVVIRDPSALAQDLRTAHLPDRDLIEDSEHGPLPARAADGRRPLDVYARPWSGARGARVAIVIGGLGVSQTGTQTAIERLPPEVTLAFAPGGNSLDRWMQAARREGHEILLQVPLEPFDYPNVNPGRNTLTVEAAPDENVDSLHWALSRITNYTGVMNYMGARFVADGEAMAPVMEELGRRGLLYLDDGATARSVAADTALANRVPFAAADNAIDARQERAAILERLDELERIARARGFAIGTGSAFDVTVATVASWVAEARRRGIEIVPVSALVADPERG